MLYLNLFYFIFTPVEFLNGFLQWVKMGHDMSTDFGGE